MGRKKCKKRSLNTSQRVRRYRKSKSIFLRYYVYDDDPPQTYYYDADNEIRPEVQKMRIKYLKKLRYLQSEAPERHAERTRMRPEPEVRLKPKSPKFRVPKPPTAEENFHVSPDIEKEMKTISTPRALHVENETIENEYETVLDQLIKQRELLRKSQLTFSKKGSCTADAFARFMEKYQPRPFLRSTDSMYGNETYIEFIREQGFL
ncbi:uncharacterized protein LOC106663992 [Cimex lectularius]|uniref:Uncharacterized protein n=1 Tax=Cimex lectularius TaxID=79782 RepID=A0A8I6RF53_CIMLE|nr:uncharacterized protein LOC106663992 [Cimex lectularius]XP_014244775.1 uncharacterized protein LOC106663992 [Cimex lectularius]XP_014244776.1 uncharacterized protein LOC106663992 [Cimex lectularius]XP_024082410.1 uncharacterized protein LOC106663992 [Cimex lectularius]